MNKRLLIAGFLLLFIAGLPLLILAAETPKASGPSDVLIVSGTVTNAQGKAVKEVGLHFFVNGKKVVLEEEVTTSKAGRYEAELKLLPGTLPAARVELEAGKPSYKTSERIRLEKIVQEKVDEKGNTVYLAHQKIPMKRAISPAFWIATLVLLLVYALIAFEIMHRTLAAMLGAAMLLFITYTAGTFYPEYTILTFEDAMHAMDMNVIFLLMAMMIIVGIMKKTGVFQWLA
ncbi:MAG: citrate transporter, partial [Desulfobacca sp.]|nr:citrate transporter [Desulfobacca sp.]